MLLRHRSNHFDFENISAVIPTTKYQIGCQTLFWTTKISEYLLELNQLLQSSHIDMGNVCTPNVFTPNDVLPGQSNAVVPMALELGYQRKDIDRMFKWVGSIIKPSLTFLEVLNCFLDIVVLTMRAFLYCLIILHGVSKNSNVCFCQKVRNISTFFSTSAHSYMKLYLL